MLNPRRFLSPVCRPTFYVFTATATFNFIAHLVVLLMFPAELYYGRADCKLRGPFVTQGSFDPIMMSHSPVRVTVNILLSATVWLQWKIGLGFPNPKSLLLVRGAGRLSHTMFT